MAQPVLDRAPAAAARHLPVVLPLARRHAPAPAHPAAPDPTIHVLAPDYGVRTVESRPGSESAIALAAVHADVIRLEFSVAVPSVGALSRVAALVEEAVAASGRDRAEVRVLLDLEVVLAGDERTARRKRSQLEHLDALAGLTWSPADTRVVTTADRLVAEVRELARRAGVDGVVLHPLAGGPAAAAELRALVAA
jgi:alkanesulfonate monooxygenase SsuD/methylene tetrahydromethanopterin reductase-like flavin-dependent oxidoreductase (luciferase family)